LARVCGPLRNQVTAIARRGDRTGNDSVGPPFSLLDRLCSEDYLDPNLEVRGLLKHGQVGNAFDSYTSWGDYYFTEALARETGMEINWW